MSRLADKRALVTGSSSGIGAGVALAFAAEGADVVINHPGPEQRADAQAVVDQITALGRLGVAVAADVADRDQVDRLVETAAERLGGIDILVNNAGFAESAPIENLAVEAWDRMIAVHLRGVFLATRRV